MSCINRLRARYLQNKPTLWVPKDDKLVSGWDGQFVDDVEIFMHQCFAPKFMIGKDLNVRFPPVTPENKMYYRFRPAINGETSSREHEMYDSRYFCRRCCREYAFMQSALLCGMRCTLLEEVFTDTTGTLLVQSNVQRSVELLGNNLSVDDVLNTVDVSYLNRDSLFPEK